MTFHVDFKSCRAGWIRFEISAGAQRVEIRASDVFDPFPEMLSWLEGMAFGGGPDMIEIDEEGDEKLFVYVPLEHDRVRLTINRIADNFTADRPLREQLEPILDAVVGTRVCIAELYGQFRQFVESPAFEAIEWFGLTVADALAERGYPPSVETLRKGNAREITEFIWSLHPSYIFDRSKLRPGETWDPDGAGPAHIREKYYEVRVPDAYDGCDAAQREACLRRMLGKKLYDLPGTDLRPLKSLRIEEWLGTMALDA